MNTNQNIIRWGIIGAGNVAEFKSGPPLYRTPGSALVAVMRRDAAKAEDFARRHGTKRWYTDAEALIADPEINAVYIASPHDLHATHVTLVAQAHKFILCEKPMGRSSAEAQTCVDVCIANDVSLTVAYYRRFWPITRAIQHLIAQGAIGRVVQARVQVCDYTANDAERSWRESRAQSGGGALANTGSHWVDLIRLFLGEVQDVMAYCSPELEGDQVDFFISAQLRTRSGALVNIVVNQQSPTSINELEILGTEGRILGSPYSEGRYLVERANHQPELVSLPNSGPAHTDLVGELVTRLQTGQPAPIPGDEAVAVWRIMEAIYRSCEEGTRVKVA
ncbi:MAG: Gfo/Idh/MocA family oxidoreductase [Chloroflexi bacterium]|nr:Gfo/Idh/MocA family oxidoreductase [Chloroflexota bacterium]